MNVAHRTTNEATASTTDANARQSAGATPSAKRTGAPADLAVGCVFTQSPNYPGVPIVYRLAESARLQVLDPDGSPTVIPGTRLGPELSESLFGREPRIAKLVVDVPAASLR